MKANDPCLTVSLPSKKSWVAVYADLVKLRLTLLVLLTTATGYFMGAREAVDLPRLFHTLWGTGWLACGAAALNQLLERDYDARMRRTQDRPLPSQRLQPGSARIFGVICTVGGALYLARMGNLLAGLVGAATACLYLGVYTPLKRRTWLNTLVGAVPGALPPVIGWAAARNDLGAPAWILFAVQFCWQIPHFLAVAWMYREDYAQAGFVMLPVVDRSGRLTGSVAAAYGAGTVLASLLPVAAGWVGVAYGVWAIILGGVFAWYAAMFWRRATADSSRHLFLASIIYLPLLFMLLVRYKGGS